MLSNGRKNHCFIRTLPIGLRLVCVRPRFVQNSKQRQTFLAPLAVTVGMHFIFKDVECSERIRSQVHKVSTALKLVTERNDALIRWKALFDVRLA
jgi:hypothetical protein